MKIEQVNETTAVVTGMAVKTETFAELIGKAGIKTPKTATFKNAIVSDIQNNGGYVPNDASAEAIALLGNIQANSRAMDTAKSKIALAFAIMDETGEYSHMHDVNGKPFKSAVALFRAVFPSIADSTARNYVACGKAVYLPALKGTLDAGLQKLASAEPGMLQFALSSLKKESEKAALMDELTKVKPNSRGKYTAADIKGAVNHAKERVKESEKANNPANPANNAADDSKRENGTAGTANKDAKAKQEVDRAAFKTALIQAIAPEYSNGEIHFTIGEDRVARFKNTLKEAAKNPNAAKLFVDVLLEIVERK